jgi:hypothetical protein
LALAFPVENKENQKERKSPLTRVNSRTLFEIPHSDLL